MQSVKDILAKYNNQPGPGPTPPAGSEPSVTCTLCQDRGIILEGDMARPCQCMQQKAMRNKFKHAGISAEMLQQTFDNFRFDYYSPLLADQARNRSYLEHAQRALQAAREFVNEYAAQGQAPGLMFMGSVGSGKTFLACAVANALTEQDKQVLFLVVPDLLDELRATFGKKYPENTEQDLLDAARTVPVLILDDLGAHNYTEWTKNRIFSIINYRMNHSLPTVITTNLDINELDTYLGERTTSRLLQMCRAFRLFVAQDIRMLKYQEREQGQGR